MDLPYSEDPDDDVFLEAPLPLRSAAKTIPIEKIIHGVIKTTDGRYVKILQVTPVNIIYKSASEQQKVIDQFEQFLRICPVNMHIKSIATPLPSCFCSSI